jgi:hypothetical protein
LRESVANGAQLLSLEESMIRAEDMVRLEVIQKSAMTSPARIEAAAGLAKTPRDQWDAAHQRCRAALLDLKSSLFSGVLTEGNVMDTLQALSNKL